ncbi:MAG: hypothetical protein GF347_03860 [Candidatus Moranbacteria bacterium]|nr:hypothetical protein [Candidatus Moranbacteria bacterium]
MQQNKKQRGFSVVEIILAGAILSFITTIIIASYLYGLKNIQYSSNRQKAISLAEECLEAIQNIRQQDFDNLTEGTHGLTYVNNKWELNGDSDITEIFLRRVDINVIDSDTKQLVCNITWPQNGLPPGEVVLTAYHKKWFLEDLPLPFNPIGGWNFDEGTGDTVTDLSGNCDGTLYNGTEWDEGVSGSGLDLESDNNEYVEGNCTLVIDYPFTVSAWIKIEDPLTQDGVVFAIADSTKLNSYYGIYIRPDGYAVIAARKGKKVKTAVSASTVDDGEWHLITGVFAGKKDRSIYIDGVFETNNDSSVNYNQTADRWSIGRWPNRDPTDYFEGKIDSVRFYDKVLTDSEISQLYDEFN